MSVYSPCGTDEVRDDNRAKVGRGAVPARGDRRLLAAEIKRVVPRQSPRKWPLHLVRVRRLRQVVDRHQAGDECERARAVLISLWPRMLPCRRSGFWRASFGKSCQAITCKTSGGLRLASAESPRGSCRHSRSLTPAPAVAISLQSDRVIWLAALDDFRNWLIREAA